MRPKLLEIEGLQSFRELQRIDFETLGETGLFGIFGPTGSGKSTVLDAITFALYGKVKRAGGTLGILNANEDTLKVRFVFEILREGSRKAYRIDRTYQRKKGSDHACEPKIARLIEISAGGEIPVCDKPSEVGNTVRELLGLSHDDFTRAVVLPQGSFQEFLMLGNAERRSMLERIFYLEEYGRRLQDKLSRKLGQLKSRLDTLKGELAAYADATDEALSEAGAEWKAAQAEQTRLETELSQLEPRYREAGEVFQLMMEQARAEQALKQHQLKQELFAQQRRKLDLAEKADSLLELIQSTRDLTENQIQLQALLKQGADQLAAAGQKRDKDRNLYEDFRKQAASEQPRLGSLRTRLEEALGVMGGIRGLTEKKEEAATSLEKLRAEYARVHRDIGAATAEAERMEQELETLSRKADTLKVSPEFRAQLQEGLRLEGLFELLAVKKEAADRARQALDILTAGQEELAGKMRDLKAEQERAEADMESRREEQARALKELEGQNALLLSLTLKPGQPCPVCGSDQHPRPAASSGTADVPLRKQEAEAAQQAFKAAEAAFRQAETRCLLAEKEGITLAGRILESTRELALKTREFEAALQKLPEAFQHPELPEAFQYPELQGRPGACVADEIKRLAEQDQQLKEVEKQILHHQTAIRDRRLQLDQWKEKRAEVESQGMKVRTELGQHIELLADKARKIKELLEISELPAEDVSDPLAGLPGEEDVQEEIRRTIQKLQNGHDETENRYQAMQEAEKQYGALAAEQSGLQTRLGMVSLNREAQETLLIKRLAEKGFSDAAAAERAILSASEQQALKTQLEDHQKQGMDLHARLEAVQGRLQGRRIGPEEWESLQQQYQNASRERDESMSRSGAAKNRFELLTARHARWTALTADFQQQNHRQGLFDQIQKLLKAELRKDNSFIDFIAEERLRYIAARASETLGVMTRFKYALELDADAGFIIRDNANGGIHRSVTTLSGGETFLTSLALALALSEQIQLKGQSPLEFFFLDEGFGTLDNQLLDNVVDSLERLSSRQRVIGLISHVPELRNRIARRLLVTPPTGQGDGSTVRIEKA